MDLPLEGRSVATTTRLLGIFLVAMMASPIPFITIAEAAGESEPCTEPFDTTPTFTDYCYHQGVWYSPDTAQYDVLIIPSQSPFSLRETQLLEQSLDNWENAIREMSAPWLAEGFEINDYTVGKEFVPPAALADPEVIVALHSNAVPGGFAGLATYFPGSCHGQQLAETLSDIETWHQHPGSPVGHFQAECDGGGHMCTVTNAGELWVPNEWDRRRNFDLISHEIGHCLTLGHVGDAADAGDTTDNSWAYPHHDIMSYESDGIEAATMHCPSTLNILTIERAFAHLFDIPGATTATAPSPNAYTHMYPEDWETNDCEQSTADITDADYLLEFDPTAEDTDPTIEDPGVPTVTFDAPEEGATYPEGTVAINGTVDLDGVSEPMAPTADAGDDQSGVPGARLAFASTVTGNPEPECQWTFDGDSGSAVFVGTTTDCDQATVTSDAEETVTVRITATNDQGSATDTAMATWAQTEENLPGHELGTDETGDTVAGCDADGTPCINDPNGSHDIVRLAAADDTTRLYAYITMDDLTAFDADQPFAVSVRWAHTAAAADAGLFYSMDARVTAADSASGNALFANAVTPVGSGGPGVPTADVQARVITPDTIEVSVDLASIGNPVSGQTLQHVQASVRTPDNLNYHTVDTAGAFSYTMGSGTPASATLFDCEGADACLETLGFPAGAVDDALEAPILDAERASISTADLGAVEDVLYVNDITPDSPVNAIDGQYNDEVFSFSTALNAGELPSVRLGHSAGETLLENPAVTETTFDGNVVLGDSDPDTSDTIRVTSCVNQATQTAFVQRYMVRAYVDDTEIASRLHNPGVLPPQVPTCIGTDLDVGWFRDDQATVGDSVLDVPTNADGDVEIPVGSTFRVEVDVDTFLGGGVWGYFFQHANYPANVRAPLAPAGGCTTCDGEFVDLYLDDAGEPFDTIEVDTAMDRTDDFASSVGLQAGPHSITARWYTVTGGEEEDITTGTVAFNVEADEVTGTVDITSHQDGEEVTIGDVTFNGSVVRDDGNDPLAADITESSVTGTEGETMSYTSTVSGGDGTYDCSWSADGGSPTFSNADCSGADVVFATVGTYTVTLDAQDGSGRTASDTAQAVVNEDTRPLDVDAGGPYSGDVGTPVSVVATVTGGAGDASCAWTLTSGSGSFADPAACTTTFTGDSTGDHTIEVTATDSASSTASDTATVTLSDTTDPRIDITSPMDGATDLESPVDVTGTVGGLSGGSAASTAFDAGLALRHFDQGATWMADLHEALSTVPDHRGLVPDVDAKKIWAVHDGEALDALPSVQVPTGWDVQAVQADALTATRMSEEIPTGTTLPVVAPEVAAATNDPNGGPWNLYLGPGTQLAISHSGEDLYFEPGTGLDGWVGFRQGAGLLCTTNFVYKDQDSRLYLGSAGHCFLPSGKVSTHGDDADFDPEDVRVYACMTACPLGGFAGNIAANVDGEVGTGTWVELGPVEYARQSKDGRDNGWDFGLVEVPEALHESVSPVMPTWQGPVSVEDSIVEGHLFIHGNGAVVAETAATKSRTGIFIPAGFLTVQEDDGKNWEGIVAGFGGDSGSSVGYKAWGAASLPEAGGLLTHGWSFAGEPLPLHSGTTMQQAIAMAEEAGLCIETVLAGEDPTTKAPVATCDVDTGGTDYEVEHRVDGGSWISASSFDQAAGSWSVDGLDLSPGAHTVDVRLLADDAEVATDSVSFTIADPVGPTSCGDVDGKVIGLDPAGDFVSASGAGAASDLRCFGADLDLESDELQFHVLVEDASDVQAGADTMYYDLYYTPSWSEDSWWSYVSWDGTTLGSVFTGRTYDNDVDFLTGTALHADEFVLGGPTATAHWHPEVADLLVVTLTASDLDGAPDESATVTGAYAAVDTYDGALSTWHDYAPDTQDGSYSYPEGTSNPLAVVADWFTGLFSSQTASFGPTETGPGEHVELYVDGAFVGSDEVDTVDSSDTWSIPTSLADPGTYTVTAQWYVDGDLVSEDAVSITVVEPDSDGDGVADDVDNCPSTHNPDQADLDDDGTGDACDDDRDGDGVPNDEDAFPDDGSEWSDGDGDGVGDNSDACEGHDDGLDTDGDGTPNHCDDDVDGDGQPNDRDGDSDGDGYPDGQENARGSDPYDPESTP